MFLGKKTPPFSPLHLFPDLMDLNQWLYKDILTLKNFFDIIELKKGGGYMETYKIAHYQKSGSMWFTNGGKLIITEREYIVKYLFQTVAKFAIDKTVASRLSANPINVGISLTDGINSIDLYFFKKTAEKLYDRFKF